MISPEEMRQIITSTEKGSILPLEVSAGSKKERFPAGYNPWRQAVGIQVKANPIEGKANKAIISLVAGTLGLPKSAVHIISGQTSSCKKILIEGFMADTLAITLSILINDTE